MSGSGLGRKRTHSLDMLLGDGRRQWMRLYVPLGMKTRSYPTKAKIRQMIEAARACGLDVCGFEVSPDGAIRIMEARVPAAVATDFDRWEARL